MKSNLSGAFVAFFVSCVCSISVQAASGQLALVSTGTGDPENMTLRAQRTILEADIILTMRGQKPEALAELIKDKPVHAAGHGLFGMSNDRKIMATEEELSRAALRAARTKTTLEAIQTQREQTRKLIRNAVLAGKKVVIIDNGDPTIFGPQIGYMQEFADLKPVIVPGISSFNAANAALASNMVGGAARAVQLTQASTMHEGASADALAKQILAGVTLVFFMERDTPRFAASLKQRLPGSMPVVLVANAGLLSSQQVMRLSVDELQDRAKDLKLSNYLVYVGDALQ